MHVENLWNQVTNASSAAALGAEICLNSNRQPMVLINNNDYYNGIYEHMELMTTMQHSDQ
jgi:hypothetical protein